MMPTKQEYDAMFARFFRDATKMSSSYKPVFVYALVDAALLCGGKKPTGHKWIECKDDKIILKLDFIAARFAYYYWNIKQFDFRHMSKKMASKQNPTHDVNMVKLIKIFSKKYSKIPDIKELESSKMEKFRKDIIRDAIKPEVLKKLLHDLKKLYEHKTGTDFITFDASLASYMKSNSNFLRSNLQIKLETHLKKVNKKSIPMDVHSPFYKYIKNQICSHQRIDSYTL